MVKSGGEEMVKSGIEEMVKSGGEEMVKSGGEEWSKVAARKWSKVVSRKWSKVAAKKWSKVAAKKWSKAAAKAPNAEPLIAGPVVADFLTIYPSRTSAPRPGRKNRLPRKGKGRGGWVRSPEERGAGFAPFGV